MSAPQRFMPQAHDEVAKDLLRRLLLAEQLRQQGPVRVPAEPVFDPEQKAGPSNPLPEAVYDPQSGAFKGYQSTVVSPGTTANAEAPRRLMIDPPVPTPVESTNRRSPVMDVGRKLFTDVTETLTDMKDEPGEVRYRVGERAKSYFQPVKPKLQFRPGDYTSEPLGNQLSQGQEPGPIRVPQAQGSGTAYETSLTPPSSTDYANRAVEQIEGVAKTMPTPDYSNATVHPELGIDYYNRTGHRRPEGELPASVTSGVGVKRKNPDLPVRIPTLSDAAVSDSTVQEPIAQAPLTEVEGGPQRLIPDPAAHEVSRLAGESDAAYNVRKHRAFSQALRNESPDSEVKETATGVTIDPPMKRRGIKGRGLAGLLMALGNMKGNTPAANAGSAIVNFLTGAIAPDFERKLERGYQVQVADAGSKSLDEAEQRDYVALERKARTEQLNDYPRRQADDEKDKRWGRREQQMRLLAASPAGFDPQHNEEHKRLQLKALADGQMLPAIPPKIGRSATQTPHTSTRSVTAGEYPGVKAGTKIRQMWNGESFEDEIQNGRPVISAEPTERAPRAVTPDIRGDLRSQLAEVEADIASNQTEFDRHSKDVTTKDRWIQTEAARRKAAAAAADPTGLTLESKRSLKDWVDMLRADDPDVAGGAYDDSVTSRDWLSKDLAEKKAMAKQLRTQLEQEERRARVAPGAGRTFSTADVQAWAKARGITVAKARRMLEKEGATIE